MCNVKPDDEAVSRVVIQPDAAEDRQRAFFVADILDPAPKNDVASMEHPIFALRAGDMQVRSYDRNGQTITVLPGATGCATIHDKDLWIYCISQLIEAANRGRAIAPTVRFTAFDFLRATHRDTSGRAYERMIEMLRRLKGTVVETSIETGGLRENRGFGLIDGWRVVEQSQDVTRMVAVEVDLPKWLFRSVQEKRVLTLSSAYFRLRKPMERRIYELARKHCGRQPLWRVSLTVLHQKSGSVSALRRFRFEMKALAESRSLPDYSMSLDAERDELTFYASSPKGQLAKVKDMFMGRSHAPPSAHREKKSNKARGR
ncbi:replication initiator protein A [Providencia sp. PROV140]|uniref:replication initiator protein A n=1 Tax=Providencia sp. PROV140 TaxID=2949850 RepID=UPI00234A1F06|nr:replication initiator protein A [Providencia sp. PROV140]